MPVIAIKPSSCCPILLRPEREILGAIPYQENLAILHTDERLMPKRKLAWAAWNYHVPKQPAGRVCLTYNMNILQSLPVKTQFLVSLNRSDIQPGKVLGSYVYSHPIFTVAGVAAQKRRAEINGERGNLLLRRVLELWLS